MLPARFRFPDPRLVTAAAALLLAPSLAGCGGARGEARPLEYNPTVAESLRGMLDGGVTADGGGPASLAEPTGWARVTGTFTLDGPPPPNAPLDVTKDMAVCAPGGQRPLSRDVVVGPGGGLQNVLIYVSSKIPTDSDAWIHPDFAENAFEVVEFDQKDCIFLTRMATMRSTQTLRVLNSDPIGHNTNLDSKRGAAPGNFTVAAGASQPYQPGGASPAPFPITCSIHPWMKAWMMVCDHPYFAVTDENGRFELNQVPAGVELELRVWQEASKYLETVSVNGQDERWSKGRVKVSLAPDENYEMNVVVSNSVFQ